MTVSDPHTVSIVLGTQDDVPRLFAYPNNSSGVGYLEQTLEETVCHYINLGLKRDAAQCQATRLVERGDTYELVLTGADADQFSETIAEFMAAGKVALEAGKELNTAGNWEWNWRFYLPLGVAMRNTLSIELLHFPPDYTFERDQDYLLANTLIRWGACLELQGVSTEEVNRYQSTLDIMPIGAPSNAGNEIDEKVGRVYSAYARDLLAKWSKTGASGHSPLVAFGGTVRKWLEKEFDLPALHVGDVGVLDVDGTKMPYIIANHPSRFYNVIDESKSEEENYAVMYPIMMDDLISARWQIRMSTSPQPDPKAVYEEAHAYYHADGQTEVCEQVWIQGFHKTKEEAQKWCGVRLGDVAAVAPPSDAELLEQGIHPEQETDRLVRFADMRKALLAT